MATKLQSVGDALNDLGKPVVHATLAAAMAEAFGEIEAATKSAENPAFKQGGKASKYADLTSIIEAIKPPLIKHGLFFTQRCHPDPEGVSVETVLHHSSGEKESLGTLYVPANKKDPQGFGSALTYARRYSLQTAFGVPVDDDDGNAAAQNGPRAAAPPVPSGKISAPQRDELLALAEKAGVDTAQLCSVYNIDSVADLPADKFERAKGSLNRRLENA